MSRKLQCLAPLLVVSYLFIIFPQPRGPHSLAHASNSSAAASNLGSGASNGARISWCSPISSAAHQDDSRVTAGTVLLAPPQAASHAS
ncbi:hypothetical protein BDW22DRAFT_1363598 [Trametopsis cervina]|nr:hypothetical protein BDW22DRAFT_1363598 [Trametopsis cervina]